MSAERTLIIVKPDGVQRGLVSEILGRFERRGLKIAALKFMQIDRELAERHYAVHVGKFFYDELVAYITSGPVVVAVLEGPKVIEIVRSMIGKTRPNEAVGGTIRGDFAVEGLRNLIHASDAPETAAEEIELYFRDGEVVNYSRAIDHWVTG
ncbi:MAG: nucleoside-diphosphate kinase [Proteobacteria bacterium]|nr:nucleoside-diphosphate kinase [Pseudomonadota bacterium]HAN16662.1 nucleoside-diphosphate kinase [Chloroflexota bacterium]NBT01942.1 nucleoside-diphosphate kinase [Pseudomonadota bacterium]NBT18137.1 nucleoside-diphosphate kinase [Pseudomonadota bacterium]NBY46409.1 nucleoside-diphosphate kinase [Pseudomonadota bacterium]